LGPESEKNAAAREQNIALQAELEAARAKDEDCRRQFEKFGKLCQTIVLERAEVQAQIDYEKRQLKTRSLVRDKQKIEVATALVKWHSAYSAVQQGGDEAVQKIASLRDELTDAKEEDGSINSVDAKLKLALEELEKDLHTALDSLSRCACGGSYRTNIICICIYMHYIS
jgi:hypothetical protein